MKICKKCNVLINDDTDICPLCKYLLHEDKNINESVKQHYPKIEIPPSKYNIATKILFIISLVIIIVSIIINIMVPLPFNFSILCITGILYCWGTTLYSIKKNKNIASQVLLQAVFLQILIIIVDVATGFKNWSFDYAIPIILVVSNIIMFILSIVSNKDFSKYVLYQIIITLCSLLPIIFYLVGLTKFLLPTLISITTSLVIFICVFIFCNHDFKEEFKRRFHF